MPAKNTFVRETKTLSFHVKATGITTNEDGKKFGQIEAYGAIFDNIDEGNDRILKGAFTRTIKNSKSRAQSREKKYLLPMLWQHDTKELIGGWYDLKEDATGLLCKGEVLLATQRGSEYYELADAGMTDQFSIIYDVIGGPNEGYSYEKSTGVRDLKELRLYSIDPVTFAMNDETYLVGVKSAEGPAFKTACGSTSGPIGPRDESWDGSAAKNWIWGKALDEDGNVKPSVAKKYFMRLDGDPSLKTSYGYPFWTNDHISVGGVKAVANALAGARNADAGGDEAGMRRKVERLYGRINAKYPDAEKLVPPWKNDDGKESGEEHERKSLLDHYNEEMAADLLVDWQDVYVCSLTCAMLDALKEDGDVGKVLDDFKMLVMEKFMPQVDDVDLASYLEDHSSSYSSADHMMQYGSESKPLYGGYMSSQRDHSHKAGRALSATNAQRIADHVDNLKAMAKEHMKAIHSAADDLALAMPGSDAANDSGTPDNEQQEGKSATSHNARGTQERSSNTDTVNEDEISAAIRQLRSLSIAK